MDSLVKQVESDNRGRADIRVKTITLPSVTLLGLFVTPFPLLPALGSGKAYSIIRTLAHYRAGTVPYTVDPASILEFGNAAKAVYFDVAFGTTFLDQATDQLQEGTGSVTVVPAASMDNQDVFIFENGGAAMTNGNGTLTLSIYYSSIDLTLTE